LGDNLDDTARKIRHWRSNKISAASWFHFCRGHVIRSPVGSRISRQREKESERRLFHVHLLLTLLTVIFSWMLVHTVYGLRYAHAFYGDSDEPGVNRMLED